MLTVWWHFPTATQMLYVHWYASAKNRRKNHTPTIFAFFFSHTEKYKYTQKRIRSRVDTLFARKNVAHVLRRNVLHLLSSCLLFGYVFFHSFCVCRVTSYGRNEFLHNRRIVHHLTYEIHESDLYELAFHANFRAKYSMSTRFSHMGY